MRRLTASLAMAAIIIASPAAAAGLKIAVVAPAEGPFALLSKQITDGASFKAKDRGTEIIPIAETCEASGSADLAKAIVDSGAEAAIGFLCTESLEAAMPVLAPANIPAITLSVRSDILMGDAIKNNWPFFRLVPNAGAESTKITEAILARWKNEPLALIDDGTIHGRELVESIKGALAEIGLTPLFADTYRPAQEQQVALVRRLVKSGATHVFVGGDRSDIAVIARDAKAENGGLIFMGGEALNAADDPVPLEDGVLAIALPDYARQPAAADATAAFNQAGIVPEGYVLPGFSAVTLLEAAKDKAAAEDIPLRAAVARGSFETAIGTVSFGADHELKPTPYRLLEWRDDRFVEPAQQVN
ncbi:branched-chain amino acid transport system substrate-binding protein [Pararhizobium capsulatum DSM 1112]|uniref:Branched-chain amino acid transport system substrate-binding protein n=1 Tax=Pararhizobium capsulatum DSM 1112 TaxID=1121113 RepID=A0ABU0BQC4_9HYPH|nr:ABC transporter substrate-binding protein [Pararhizobium capsulatum]MDQ0320460.1 branched-chain amino acid transport system substrate-binding protein [Pararhizobium capsulatum DSM 1112]